jgi:hypothetical protein
MLCRYHIKSSLAGWQSHPRVRVQHWTRECFRVRVRDGVGSGVSHPRVSRGAQNICFFPSLMGGPELIFGISLCKTFFYRTCVKLSIICMDYVVDIGNSMHSLRIIKGCRFRVWRHLHTSSRFRSLNPVLDVNAPSPPLWFRRAAPLHEESKVAPLYDVAVPSTPFVKPMENTRSLAQVHGADARTRRPLSALRR